MISVANRWLTVRAACRRWFGGEFIAHTAHTCAGEIHTLPGERVLGRKELRREDGKCERQKNRKCERYTSQVRTPWRRAAIGSFQVGMNSWPTKPW